MTGRLLAAFACAALLAAAPVRAADWLFFPDHGSVRAAVAPADSPSDSPSDSLPTPRALARREKARRARAGLGIEVAAPALAGDAPPDASYLAALERAGARIRTVSRWMNAASVEGDAAA